MAYDEVVRERVETLFEDYPGFTAKDILEELKVMFPGEKMPAPRTVLGWGNKPRSSSNTRPSGIKPADSPDQMNAKFLRTHHPRDVARAIDVYLNHMKRRAQYAPDPPLKVPALRIHPEPDVYQQAIIATIKQIDPPFAECIRRFDEAVERGERQEAGDILNQLEKGLMTYTTKLR